MDEQGSPGAVNPSRPGMRAAAVPWGREAPLPARTIIAARQAAMFARSTEASTRHRARLKGTGTTEADLGRPSRECTRQAEAEAETQAILAGLHRP